ncbi:PRD domain-containing protein [Virgibacillus proomii]|uniref:PRD domain-containing protein n=1 Tax=Virgibacillus proomii TaxID=84407 RepID=UPI001C1243AD|nr:PRD domain-containing protein [Virgibacillus proomii]MBU5268077.1 PRD domain-containing protein [Virgibacillus proomii]
MERLEIQGKLNILLTNQVITQNASDITLSTYDFLTKKFNVKIIQDSEMFWTHLCMALTRIERGEEIEGPPEAILKEIDTMSHKETIEEIITYVDSQISKKLPSEEKNYFYLHLHRVIESNK